MAFGPKPLGRLMLPYGLVLQPSKNYVVFNRNYKPIGFNLGEWCEEARWVAYEDYPVEVALNITPKIATSLSDRADPDVTKIYLYNDGCPPWHDAKSMAAYFKRLTILMKLAVQPTKQESELDRDVRLLGGTRVDS